MNIFVLDRDPILAAQYHCDKHVVKMILETAQMLSTAVRVTQGKTSIPTNLTHLTKERTEIYKASYINHPCNIWARTNKSNFLWLKSLGLALSQEYHYRYGKTHSSFPIILSCLEDSLPEGNFIPQPLCMPDQYKTSSVVESYRQFYIHDKKFARWLKTRSAPEWYMDAILKSKRN